MKKKPCAECPWRRDVAPGSWSAERFQNLARGFESIGVRIASMRGRINLDECVSDTPLYENFEQMLDANRVEVPMRNRWVDA